MRKTSTLYSTLSITIKYPGHCSSPVLGLVFITSVMKLFRKLFASGSEQRRYKQGILRFTLRLKQQPVITLTEKRDCFLIISLFPSTCRHYRFVMLLPINVVWYINIHVLLNQDTDSNYFSLSYTRTSKNTSFQAAATAFFQYCSYFLMINI